MIVWPSDELAREKCANRKNQIVETVHKHLGLASAAIVSSVPDLEALRIETGSGGALLVDYDLNPVIREPKSA